MTTMSFVAFSSRARKARSASRVGVGSALWIALNETSVLLSSGFSWRFVLKSTRQMSGERPRATRSNVQKSPTVTTGLAPPIAGRMASPLTSFPKGHRRYSRSDSGRRNVTAANSANTEGKLPVRVDAHLLRDLGPWVVYDDHVPLPVFRCLAAAQGALVLVRDRGTVLARLRDLDDHCLPLLPGAAFRTGAVLFDPVELAERRLSHREPDFRFARRAFVQRDRDDARSDLVANPKVPLRVLADEPLSLFVHVDSIVHDLRDMQEAVQGTESHEGAEFKDFHHGALDESLERRREDQRVVSDSLVDGAVSVDDAPLADPLDVARDQGQRLVRADLPFQRRPREFSSDRVDALPQPLQRHPHDGLPLHPLTHEHRLAAEMA